MCELFLIVSFIISDLESIGYSRFGSQELATDRDSGTRAAGGQKVSEYRIELYRSNEPC